MANTKVVKVKKDEVVKAITDKTIADKVYNKIIGLENQGGLNLPQNYSTGNALKSAWLTFQDRPDLMKCTEISKANALLDMVIQGLSPAKGQCYFIPFGNKVKMQRSYLGSISAAKRIAGVKDIHAQAIYEGDELDYVIKDGIIEIGEQRQQFTNINSGKVIGAYAVVHLTDGRKIGTIMTMKQIEAAWAMGATKGKSPAHTKFADQMAIKTVINRAVKHFLNTSDDSDIVVESINKTRDISELQDTEMEEIIDKQVEEEAGTKEIDIEPKEIKEPKPETPKGEPEDKQEGEPSVFDRYKDTTKSPEF